MSSFGKPDATGRSSGKFSGRKGSMNRPPKGTPFIWLTGELLESPAWRLRSINCARLLDFLLVDHISHAGTENGALMATHEQLMSWGASRRHIRSAIDEAVFLGLIRVKRGGRWVGKNDPSIFRLTFYPDKDFNQPTNNWKKISEDDIKVWRLHRSTIAKAKMQFSAKTVSSPRKGGTVLPFRGVRDE